MSTENFTVNAQSRADRGKGASRRLRRTGLIPGIIYGGDKEPASIALNNIEFCMRLDHESFYSHILTLNLDGKPEMVILKALQRHPYKNRQMVHADFLRVVEGQEIHLKVPFHFIGEDDAPGVSEGGIFSHQMSEVEIRCLPKDLPEFIAVDVSNFNIGDNIHLSGVIVPNGVTIVALTHGEESDFAVVSMVPPRVIEVEEVIVDEAEESEEDSGEEAKSEGEGADEAASDGDSAEDEDK